MKSITIHNLDAETARMLEARARAEGLSLNRTIKKLLAEALGVVPPDVRARRHLFEEFCGVWTNEDLTEFERVTEDTRQVDPTEWE